MWLFLWCVFASAQITPIALTAGGILANLVLFYFTSAFWTFHPRILPSLSPLPGGLAHGASLHEELQLLVAAGLTPIEALRAATSVPARRFNLTDRGMIVPGARADLLLVEGDPLTNISDTLNIIAVWHQGVQLTAQVQK
jgi:hypothetical protein